MFRKIVAVWVSLVMLFGFIVIVDVVTDITPSVKATTYYVNETGSGGAYTSIQDAINDSKDGDTVFVYNGTYYENIIVNNSINLIGENKFNTTIEGGGGDVVQIIADWVNITGFYITNGSNDIGDAGIEIYNAQNCSILNNNIAFNYYKGIYLESSLNNNISGNNISNNFCGFSIRSSNKNIINGNNVTSNDDYGIVLWQSTNNVITNNTVMNNKFGIYLSTRSNNNTIDGNIATLNDYDGIHLYLSSNNTITSNLCPANRNGIFLRDSSHNSTIIGNNINLSLDGIHLEGSPNGIIKSNNISTLSGYGIYLSSSPNFNISSNNVESCTKNGIHIISSFNTTIIDNRLNLNNVGINILSSSNNNTIIGNNMTLNYWGINLYRSSDNIVLINEIHSNHHYGIEISSAHNNYVAYNNISDSEKGIMVEGSINNTIMMNNVILCSLRGIEVFGSLNNSIKNNTLLSNNFNSFRITVSSGNNVTGNIIANNDYGFSLTSSSNNSVSNNVFYNNSLYGILLDSSSNNCIFKNIVNSNIGYGINLTSSSNNDIFFNNIINNGVQSYDDLSDENQWNNKYPLGGNYWSDYSGIDKFKGPNQDIPGSDGIGDAPYIIDSDSQDNYPLMEPHIYKSLENYTVLKPGWNLISIPLIQDNQDLSKVLEMIDGSYDVVQWHDPTDSNDPWKHHKVAKPLGNDLSHLNETIGFWIHITNPGDTIFLYNGTQPSSNQTIPLHLGWNMVGYPSLTSCNRTEGLNNLTFNNQVDAIWSYDAATQKWEEMGESDNFIIGRGYYIHTKLECEWEVPL